MRTAFWIALLAGTSVAHAQQPAPYRFKLTKDSVIAGITCGPTGRAYVVLHDSGKVDECPVAADTTIDGHYLPRGTWLRLHPDDRLDGAWLSRDTELAGLPCKGTGYKGWSVRFHPGGALSLCYLSREAIVDGVPCRGAAFRTELTGSTQVNLHPDGTLHSCRLARDFTRDGVTWKRGKRITIPAPG